MTYVPHPWDEYTRRRTGFDRLPGWAQWLAMIVGLVGLFLVMGTIAIAVGGSGYAVGILFLIEVFGFCWYMEQRGRRRD
jgi:hypothetical protein